MKILIHPEADLKNELMPWGWEKTQLAPEGATRVVRKYFLFNKKLKGEKKRGRCIIRQKASVEIAASMEGAFSYSSWKDIEFLKSISSKPKYKFIARSNGRK